jgi:CRP/FNR family transcriptional regulator, cyclic AMP receptor protein
MASQTDNQGANSASGQLSLILLRTVPLFEGLDDTELERIARVAGRRRAARGEQLVRAGEPAESLLIMLNGRSKVTNFDEEGREIILAWLGPGEFFGEMGLIDGSPRSASVIAVENCELMVLGKNEFERCMQDNFQIALKLMRILVHRLREADRHIESLALLDVYGRVARLLIDMSSEEEGQRVIRKKISKQDMARMIGASREMVSKVMRDLEVGGYIHVHDDKIVITGA